MALRHGNKSYYQVLIDPNRAELIEKSAEKKGIKGTAWVREVAYEALEREFPSSEYKIAEAKDELMWRESVQRRIDGRKLIPSAEYSALNTLIQSAGALLVKQGTIILNEDLHKEGFVWGKDYAMVLHVHDEMQFIVKEEKINLFKLVAKRLFKKTQDHFKFKTQLDGEIKVGQNWSDTH